LAVVTDTGYDEGTADLAAGIRHLFHEAWSHSAGRASADYSPSGFDAGRAAAEARAKDLTLIHLDPRLADHEPVLLDARGAFPAARLGQDGLEVS
jgi:ribonuclease BN (tRNA processing enzyme)